MDMNSGYLTLKKVWFQVNDEFNIISIMDNEKLSFIKIGLVTV
jgi:hypothetical protein